MKIVTWNVNSIRARLEIFLQWLANESPDVVLLQEIKCLEAQFPKSEIEDFGYNILIFGQKTYNGVAILSKYPIEDITKGIPNFEDASSRYIECFSNGVRLASVYVPNGQEVDSKQFFYKLDFLDALKNHWQNILLNNELCVFGGDFNITPTDFDVYDPIKWHEKTLCTSRERSKFQDLLNLGLQDILPKFQKEQTYTWWDYRGGSFWKNFGLRIDHLLVNSYSGEVVLKSGTHKNVRGLEKTSDHCPVWCVLKE